MLLKVYFRYLDEEWTFLDKKFTISAIRFLILLMIVGIFYSDLKTIISMFVFQGIVYTGFGIRTIKIINTQKNFIKNGIKCSGVIKDIKIKRGHSDLTNRPENRYSIIYLIIEYLNPYTNKLEEFISESVNSNPFVYLSSLDVTVYVLPNGKAWVTDFKRIKKLSDSVEYKRNPEHKKRVDNLEKNGWKFILFSILFIVVCIKILSLFS